MKSELVSSHAARRARIESGEEKIVGVNSFETTEPSPLTANLDEAIMTADPKAEEAAKASVEARKAERDETAVTAALAQPARPEQGAANPMEAPLVARRRGSPP